MHALFLAFVVTAQVAQAVSLPRAVPYLPQTEALCGGAAAAMVMRYWGTPARPEDFAPLIDRTQNGIVTTALVADLQRRGWQAFPLRGSSGDAAVMTQHISRGRPVIALIEDRPARYHYVVVTGLDTERIHFHDPAAAPSQTMTRAEFDRRWQAANYWMLLLLPGTETVESTEPVASEFASRVAALLRSGDKQQALKVATDATRTNPADAVAWDAVGTTLFVMDRERDALDAWNRAGKPDIDTVQIGGLSHTRFRAAEHLIGLETGDRLTAPGLARARRRLAMLPSASSSRVGYTPLADGRVQIDAAIVERSRIPGAIELAMMATKAPFSRDVEAAFTNLVGAGERVSGSYRFREGFQRAEVGIETPAPLPIGAVWKLSGFAARETFAVGPLRITPRWQRAAFQAADWISSSFGWTAAAGVERWPTAALTTERKFYAGARGSFAAGSWLNVQVTAEGWMRGRGATRLSGRANITHAVSGGRIDLTGGAEGVHGVTPRFLWPGTGDGHIRRPLLRAHPLIHDGAITTKEGGLFARRLWYGTAEWSRSLARLGPATIDAALFTDGAYAKQLLDGRGSDYQMDAGTGLRVRLLGGGPAFRIDIAKGVRDGRWAVTAGTVLTVNSWIF